MQPEAVLVIKSPSRSCRKPVTCREGGLRCWTSWNRPFRGTLHRVTLTVSVPPLEEWFAGTVMSPDLEQKQLPLIWGICIKRILSQRAGRAKWEREHEDQKSVTIWCAPLVKRRVRICDENTEGKEVKRAEMLQYEEKMNNKTSSEYKVEREAISSTHYGNTGEDKQHSKPSKRKH